MIAVVVVATSCGSTSTAIHRSPASPTSSPTQDAITPSPAAPCSTPAAKGSALIAVLEAKGAGTGGSGLFGSHDTLAITDRNAVAHARATFQPRQKPYIGNAATILGPYEAYVVGGTVYFIDGRGTVRSMGSDGKQRTVTSFPIGQDQQEVSFAVSPDACHLAATVMTAPPKGPPPSGEPFPTLNGTWKVETMIASAGQTAQVLHTWTSPSYPGQPTPGSFANVVVVGWDSVGPIVVVGSALGTQNSTFLLNPSFFGGSLAHLGADGMPGAPIPLPGCTDALQVWPGGAITCSAKGSSDTSIKVSVIGSTGGVLVAPFEATWPVDVAVGPGGLVAVTGGWRNGSGALIGTLPPTFHPEGWVDSTTIFGRLGDAYNATGDAAFAHLSGGRATIEDLRFKGDYVGVLTS